MNMDRKVSVALVMLEQGQSIASIARKLRMSEKTIRKYRKAGKLPSQMERPPRDYRTRQDPLAGVGRTWKPSWTRTPD
jgi:transposase